MFVIFAVRTRKTYQFKCTTPYAMDQEVKNSLSQKCRLSLMESLEKFSPFTCGLKLNTMHWYAFELFVAGLKTVVLIQFAWSRQFVLHLIGYRMDMRQYAGKMSIKSVVKVPTQTALVHVFQWNGIAKNS